MEEFINAIDFGDNYIKLVSATVVDNEMHICYRNKIATKGIRNNEIFSKGQLNECINKLFQTSKSLVSKKSKTIVVLPCSKLLVERQKVEKDNINYPEVTTKDDVLELKKELGQNSLKEGYISICMYPINYFADDKDLNKIEPYGERCKTFGMMGMVCSLPISSSREFIDNLEDKGISVVDAYISPISNASLILKKSELKTGAIILDIGGNGISVSAFYNELLCVHQRTDKGINYIIDAIAKYFMVKNEEASQILESYGASFLQDGSDYKIVNLSSEQNSIKEKDISGIVEDCLNDMLEDVKKIFEIYLVESNDLPIILTGGGANIYHIDEKVSSYFDKNVYIRNYNKVGGKDYSYNSCIGALINYLSKNRLIISAR